MHERNPKDEPKPDNGGGGKGRAPSLCSFSVIEARKHCIGDDGLESTVSVRKPVDLSLMESGGIYEKPLSCFGCGIGWFSFLFGFGFPPLWFYATVLYFGNYHHKDPRERPGLAASAIAALICSVIVLVSLLAVFC